jgi:hypothetical protein
MTTPHRRRWMREFMLDYRRSPGKYEQLRKDHRVDSFIYRLSKLLSPRYDILMCMQYGPFLVHDISEDASLENNGGINRHEENFDDEFNDYPYPYNTFPIFLYFYIYFEPGGGDVFKLFCYTKYYLDGASIRAILGMIGVLDKCALLNELTRLTGEGRIIWRDMIRKLEKESKEWREINLSDDRDPVEYGWKSIEWASHDSPDWNSVQFQTFLRLWKAGNGKIGKREADEWWDGNVKYRFVASPIFEAMKPVVLEVREARGYGSRP